MDKGEQVIFKAKLNGYNFVYEDGIINVYSEDIIDAKTAQCIFRCKCECTNRKDFEMEVIHAHEKLTQI